MDEGKSAIEDSQRRTPLACNRCRRRRQKCSGQPRCKLCIESNEECIFPEVEKKSYVSDNYVQSLKEKISFLERQLRELSSVNHSTMSPPLQETLPSGYDSSRAPSSGPIENIDNHLLDGMEQLVLTQSGQTRYRGNSSSTSFGLHFRGLVQGNMIPDDYLNTELEQASYANTAWPTRRPITTTPELPPYGYAKRLHAAMHMYIGTIFSFLDPRAFHRRLEIIYARKGQEPNFSNREDCLAYCQVLLVFAFGQMYSVNQWTGYDGPPGFSYFMQALQLLPEIHEEGSILFVEVLSLVGYFMQNLNRRDAAFLYIGLAVRMAISLGLHQEVSDPTLDKYEREHRRRLWWSVYSMDRILCSKSGNPITISDADINVQAPSRIPEIEPELSSATVLLHYTKLSRTLGYIMERIYRKSSQTGQHLVASVQEIMASLSNWLSELPLPLRFDFDSLNTSISRESVSIFLHYYQCINMTARPLLFHVVSRRLSSLLYSPEATPTDWRAGFSATTVAVVEYCIQAARASTKIMAAEARQNLVATYGYMDTEHAFSAALVLVMVQLAFPPGERHERSMETILGVLRGMADRGNAHVRARYRLLCDLKAIVEKGPTQQSQQQEDFFQGQNMGSTSSTIFPVSYALSTSSNPLDALCIPTAPSPPGAAPPSSIFNQNLASNTTDAVQQGVTNTEIFTAPFADFETSAADNVSSTDYGVIGDAGLFEEVYGNFDVGLDIDWTEAARLVATWEGGPGIGSGREMDEDEPQGN